MLTISSPTHCVWCDPGEPARSRIAGKHSPNRRLIGNQRTSGEAAVRASQPQKKCDPVRGHTSEGQSLTWGVKRYIGGLMKPSSANSEAKGPDTSVRHWGSCWLPMKHTVGGCRSPPSPRLPSFQRAEGGLSNPHVDACELGIETAREDLSILTGLPNKITSALDFPRRLPLSTGRLGAACGESCPGPYRDQRSA